MIFILAAEKQPRLKLRIVRYGFDRKTLREALKGLDEEACCEVRVTDLLLLLGEDRDEK